MLPPRGVPQSLAFGLFTTDPMAATLKLYVDWFSKSLITNPGSITPFVMPPFFEGDTVPIRITILEPDPNGSVNSFIYPPIDNMSLKLGVSDTPTGTAGGPALLVSQFVWTKVTGSKPYFEATVAFNSGALGAFIGAAASATAFLELEITEGAAVTTIYQGQITIKAEVIESGSVAVVPGLTALDLDTAMALFLPRRSEAGATWTSTSPNGLVHRTLGVRDDGSGQDDLT